MTKTLAQRAAVALCGKAESGKPVMWHIGHMEGSIEFRVAESDGDYIAKAIKSYWQLIADQQRRIEELEVALGKLITSTDSFDKALEGHLYDSDYELDEYLGQTAASLRVQILPEARKILENK